MLPHYSPLKVAETFSMLSALAPGRIDLGLGRAAGTDPTTTYALQRDRRQAAPDDFPQQLVELLGHLDDTLPADHPFARLRAAARHRERPEPWLLGSSPQSGIWAAELGLPYAFADFINPAGEADHEPLHRGVCAAACAPHASPRGLVAVWALCAETDAEAQRLSASSRMAFTLFQRGELRSRAADRRPRWSSSRAPLDDPFAVVRQRRSIVGSPATVVPQIRGWRASTVSTK